MKQKIQKLNAEITTSRIDKRRCIKVNVLSCLQTVDECSVLLTICDKIDEIIEQLNSQPPNYKELATKFVADEVKNGHLLS